jgi:DNA-binding CsgD family transcriptional regulator
MWVAAALKGHATGEVWAGRFDAAEIDLADAADLSAAAGEHPMSGEMIKLEVSAIRDRVAQTRQSARTVINNAAELGSGSAALFAHHALLLLELGTGDYDEALGHAAATITGRVGAGHQVLADVVEAAARGGDPDMARAAVDCLAERAPASGTPWAAGLLARCQALLAGDEAERLYQRAIELLGSTRMAVELARAHLLYGEWLRRQKRRIEARDHLRIAYNAFEDMGADAFAIRTRHELQATGERARKRNIAASRQLTPQEEHIARLAAAGETNAEIAGKLFIAPTTVEYHLRKVFQKLSVTSRRQLRPAFHKLETELSPP